MGDRCLLAAHDLSHPSGECDDGAVLNLVRRQLAALAAACALVIFAGAGLAAATSGDSTDSSTDPVVTEDTIYGYDLENDPSECINFLPRPNCGKKPEAPGDRGGALQYTVLGVILAGIGVIGTVIARNVIRRDRAINQALNTTPTESVAQNNTDTQ